MNDTPTTQIGGIAYTARINSGAPEPKKWRGMTWVPVDQMWIVRIRVQGTRFYLGKFKDRLNAALAYDNALWFLQDYMCAVTPKLNRPDRPPITPDPKVLAIRCRLKQSGFPCRPSGFTPPTFEKLN
jgi:hypothetical protein